MGAERGIGLLRALDLKNEIGAKVIEIARDQLDLTPGWANTGPLLNSPRPALLRFMPALNLSGAEIDLMISGLRATVLAIHADTIPKI